MKEITRVSAGVMFESDVLAFIDNLAATQQRNRSFIINNIIRYYARANQSATVPLEPAAPLPIPKPLETPQMIRF
jgi:metal-responsive CopG/Arc/MetJ family transcriptional regulator